jgi:hypothetical protein
MYVMGLESHVNVGKDKLPGKDCIRPHDIALWDFTLPINGLIIRAHAVKGVPKIQIFKWLCKFHYILLISDHIKNLCWS